MYNHKTYHKPKNINSLAATRKIYMYYNDKKFLSDKKFSFKRSLKVENILGFLISRERDFHFPTDRQLWQRSYKRKYGDYILR